MVLAKYLLRIAVLECRLNRIQKRHQENISLVRIYAVNTHFASMHIVYNAPRGWNMDSQRHVGEIMTIWLCVQERGPIQLENMRKSVFQQSTIKRTEMYRSGMV